MQVHSLTPVNLRWKQSLPRHIRNRIKAYKRHTRSWDFRKNQLVRCCELTLEFSKFPTTGEEEKFIAETCVFIQEEVGKFHYNSPVLGKSDWKDLRDIWMRRHREAVESAIMARKHKKTAPSEPPEKPQMTMDFGD